MNENEILNTIKTIFNTDFDIDLEQYDLNKITIDKLNLDSIDSIEFVLKLEDQFNIEIPDEIAETMFDSTINNIVKCVHEIIIKN